MTQIHAPNDHVTRGSVKLADIATTRIGGDSVVIDLVSSIDDVIVAGKHINGPGPVGIGAKFSVEMQMLGGSEWFLVEPVHSFGMVPGTTEVHVIRVPVQAISARIAYIEPSGGTGHVLKVEAGIIEIRRVITN